MLHPMGDSHSFLLAPCPLTCCRAITRRLLIELGILGNKNPPLTIGLKRQEPGDQFLHVKSVHCGADEIGEHDQMTQVLGPELAIIGVWIEVERRFIGAFCLRHELSVLDERFT